MNFWDQQFSGAGFKYGTRPNAFLLSQASRLPSAARILVPGDGEGRNSVWLASQGHQVLAMDGSAVGLAKAQALAAEQGVRIATQLADLADWQPPAGAFDALVLTYVHLPPAIRASAHQRLADALRPGGLLILEAFHPKQLERSSGGPKQLDMLYALADLEADFAGRLQWLLREEVETVLDEGPGHQGPAWVTRLVGRRT
ncbi:class I SAM-dependent methyltransferase [Malikia granosa]|uniref:SAM-dependent methyltransferase n=1 Tax=Malikia granosa TaxID=263067 RepID=A0A2S9K4N1_9BURK|nr:class I SAM-dependent methyltransferase [Malikia granosa]PRD65410.1 SAM-dependent methyltransferase [Malikia granosa]